MASRVFYSARRFITRGIERNYVKVHVPATSANMGPGFDSLGMALDIWNTLVVERSDKFEMIVEGQGEEDLPRNESNLVCRALGEVFALANKPVPPLKYTCVQRIPHARGMGSSSAAIVSGVLAGIALSGHELRGTNHEEFLQITSRIEGHPDNVAPAIYGGIQLGFDTGTERGWMSSRISLPHSLQCVLFVPDFHAPTTEARAVLPDTYSKADMVYNIGRLATLVAAFQNRRFDKLKWGVQDRMHQPYRAANFPHLYPCIEAALGAGAEAAYLSGAGPTICALTTGLMGDVFAQKSFETYEESIAEAMQIAAGKAGITGRCFVTTPTQQGAIITEAEPEFSSAQITRLNTYGAI